MPSLQLDYDQHPAFRSTQGPWIVSGRLTEDFSALYGFMESHGRLLPRDQRTELAARLQAALADIFASLRKQADDSRQKMFVDELFRHSSRLLADDSRFFLRDVEYGRPNPESRRESLSKSLELATRKLFVGRLPSEAVAEILGVSGNDLTRFRQSAVAGKRTRADLSVNDGETVRQITAIINREFNAQGINDAVSMYMGQRMHVGGLALELSVAGATWWKSGYDMLQRDPKTLYFHIDESPANPKAIVYLSDVSPGTGPTSAAPDALSDVVIPPLQRLVGRIIGQVGREPDSPLSGEYKHVYHQIFGCPVFRSDFMRLPPEMRWNSHFGWDVLPDSDLENRLVDTETKILGPAGTFLVFDGYQLLHRGGLLDHSERIALQVIFSPVPNLSIARKIRTKLGALRRMVRRRVINR